MRKRREAILDLYSAVLGAFLLVSPWLLAYEREPARLDAWMSGIGVMAISIAAIWAFTEWEEWINLFLGLWMMISPWLLGFAHTTAMHVAIGVGLTVSYLASLELWLIHYSPEHRSRA